MIVDRDISKYIIHPDDSIHFALEKIAQAKSMIIIAVDQSGVVQGLFTNGDFLRWVIKQDHVDLNQAVSAVLNQNYVRATTDDTPDKI